MGDKINMQSSTGCGSSVNTVNGDRTVSIRVAVCVTVSRTGRQGKAALCLVCVIFILKNRR